MQCFFIFASPKKLPEMSEINKENEEEKNLLKNLTDSESVIESLTKQGDDTEEENDLSDDEDSQRDKTDYSSFSKEDFVNKANDLIHATEIREAHETFKKMRILFDDIIRKEREVMLKQFVADGNEARDFRPMADEHKNRFYQAYQKFLERRAAEKARAEEEKLKNLKAKKEILEKIKAIADQDESDGSLNELKELQRQWKQIRMIPKEHMQPLWESYRFALDTFYDKLSINNELKELDRQKNLEFKIELCKKVNALLEEKSIKKSHILLNKFHEDFKNTGPVPKEFSEEIWKRFKEASDEVIEQKKQQLEVVKEKRKENLSLKIVLCEKAEQLCEIPAESPKVWNERTLNLSSLFDEWKKIGPVPESNSDQIWRRFREAQQKFYDTKKAYFGKLNESKENNLLQKRAICEEAEKIANSTDFDRTTLRLIQLQEKWKSIGPVPEKYSDEIWKKFRAACDSFFKRKEGHFKEKNDAENENLKAKQAIIEKVNKLKELSEAGEALQQLRNIQKEWNAIGFVPQKNKNQINKQYSDLVEFVYNKFNVSVEEMKQSRQKEHYETIAGMPDASDRLWKEEKRVADRIKTLNSEIETLNNNIEFFASSKGAEKLKLQVQEKIDALSSQISKLKEEIKVIRSFKNSNVAK